VNVGDHITILGEEQRLEAIAALRHRLAIRRKRLDFEFFPPPGDGVGERLA